MSKAYRLELSGISKSYPGCKANDNIHLAIQKGEIHALLGENGAGKSTLMKIIYGVIEADAGDIFFNGKRVEIQQPAQARALGIGMVFQHFSLFETLSVSENIALALGRQAGNPDTLAQRITRVSSQYGIPVNPDQRVGTLSTGERQRVEIVRCLLQDIQLLILDEPTSVLTPQEVDTLFITLKQLSQQGCSILFISHKMHEIKALCDKATILRQGKIVGDCLPRQQSPQAIASMMVGEGVDINTKHQTRKGTDIFLQVKGLSTPQTSTFDTALKAIDLSVRKGEILGIAGVAGNGQEELLKALSGETLSKHSAIQFEDTVVDHLNPEQRRRLGLGFVPEDRLGRAAIAEMSLSDNTLLTSYAQGLVKKGLILRSKVKALTDNIIKRYQVKTQGAFSHASSLSGGNLQKFIIGREIEQQPQLLLASHPTWGVDIGAQIAIHKALIALRDRGCAILIVSEDLDELFQISDRLGAICDGRLSPTKATADVTLEQLGCWMTGDFSSPTTTVSLAAT